MSVKGIRVRYAKLMTLLAIFKGSVHMKFEFKRAMYITYLESLGNAL